MAAGREPSKLGDIRARLDAVKAEVAALGEGGPSRPPGGGAAEALLLDRMRSEPVLAADGLLSPNAAAEAKSRRASQASNSSDPSIATFILRRPGSLAAREFAATMEREASLSSHPEEAESALSFVLEQAQVDPWMVSGLKRMRAAQGRRKFALAAHAVKRAVKSTRGRRRSSAPADTAQRILAAWKASSPPNGGGDDSSDDSGVDSASEGSELAEAVLTGMTDNLPPPPSNPTPPPSRRSRRRPSRTPRASVAFRVSALDSLPEDCRPSQLYSREEISPEAAPSLMALVSASEDDLSGPLASMPSRRIARLAAEATKGDVWNASAGLALAVSAHAAISSASVSLPYPNRLIAESQAFAGIGSWDQFDIFRANSVLVSALTGTPDPSSGVSYAVDDVGQGYSRANCWAPSMVGPNPRPLSVAQGQVVCRETRKVLLERWHKREGPERQMDDPWQQPSCPTPPTEEELLAGALWHSESLATVAGGVTVEAGPVGWGRELLEGLLFRCILDAAAPHADVAMWDKREAEALLASSATGVVDLSRKHSQVHTLPPVLARALSEFSLETSDSSFAISAIDEVAGFPTSPLPGVDRPGSLHTLRPPPGESDLPRRPSGRHRSTRPAWPWEWELPVSHVAARKLSSLIASLYRANPYHSAVHASDVLQGFRHLLVSGGLGAHLSASSRVALVVAAAAHDVGHPGVNNAFVNATFHPLMLRYGEGSPLERMHAATLLELLHGFPDADITAEWPAATRRSAQKLAFSCILHTDNAGHFAMVDRLQARAALLAETDAARGGPLDLTPGSEDEDLIAQASLHCADIGNPSRPWLLNCRWSDLVTHEFWLQGTREAMAGLPVGPINDSTSAVPKPFAQSGFARAFCLPLLTSLGALGAVNVDGWVSHLRRNVATCEVLSQVIKKLPEEAIEETEEEESPPPLAQATPSNDDIVGVIVVNEPVGRTASVHNVVALPPPPPPPM
jgi:hypothetical protein